VCIAAVLLTTALAWPHVRQSGLGAGDDPSITVAAVQGNVPRLGLEFNAQRRAVLDNHVRETAQLADDVRAGRAPQPMVVFWPENSSDIDPLANPDARDEISIAAADIKAPILVGGVVAAPGYSPDNPVASNSVIVWNPATLEFRGAPLSTASCGEVATFNAPGSVVIPMQKASQKARCTVYPAPGSGDAPKQFDVDLTPGRTFSFPRP